MHVNGETREDMAEKQMLWRENELRRKRKQKRSMRNAV